MVNLFYKISREKLSLFLLLNIKCYGLFWYWMLKVIVGFRNLVLRLLLLLLFIIEVGFR